MDPRCRELKFDSLDALHEVITSSNRLIGYTYHQKQLQDSLDHFFTVIRNLPNPIPAWFPNHPDKPFIQERDYDPPNMRPDIVVGMEIAFKNMGHCNIVAGFGRLVEHEYITSTKQFTQLEGSLRLAMVPRILGGERYWAILNLPEGHESRFRPGESLKLCFDEMPRDNHDTTQDWNFEITPTHLGN